MVLPVPVKPCATKITDTLTFVGSRFDAFIYNWETEIFIQTSSPIFPIYGCGCGSAFTSDGDEQVVVVGELRQRED